MLLYELSRKYRLQMSQKNVTYLKMLTLTRKVKVFHLRRNLFKAERQLLRCRELTLANPLALDCFFKTCP